MDDRFLKELRKEPREPFARSLKERLRAHDVHAAEKRPLPRFAPAFGALAAVLAVVVLFSIPAVRVSAQAFLDLFRVRNFAAVTVDPNRLAQLRDQQLDIESILGKPTVTQDPGPPQAFTSAGAAAAAAGYPLRELVGVPGVTADTTYVRGETRATMHVDTSKLRSLLTALAIDDVGVPAGIDGADVSVHVPPVARTVYSNEGKRVWLLQAPAPELGLPAGVDVAQLGEIGLRIAGLSPSEAKQFAGTIDWHSTMIVPVPAGASSFRQVDVRGHKGLLVTLEPRRDRARGGNGRGGSRLLWSDGDRVYALVTQDQSDVTVVELANAVQ